MKYLSTRGRISSLPFKEAVMMGLATDGGLLLPEQVPVIEKETLDHWRTLSYPQLAIEVISLFSDDIPKDRLSSLIERSYATFTHPQVTPLVRHGDLYILELFHGPTLAFKDIALQFLGNLFEYLLEERRETMNILGATSGDTGSAAIYGVRGKERINIFILHPYQRVSRIQELQMTTVTDSNVFNIAIRGTFDDGQSIVKSIFNDISFKQKYNLGAVNSINWARIVAQIVYYVYAYLRITEEMQGSQVDFAVPTGNFGDIFAGYIARKLLPGRIGKLVLATNENDLLHRFVQHGDYSVGRVVATSSPSMDIQVASNFERYLYYLNGRDSKRTRSQMESFASSGKLEFDGEQQSRIQEDFSSKAVSEPETEETIRLFYRQHNYILDPHTAVGINAAISCRRTGVPIVCLATAHAAKFGDAVQRAIGRQPQLPAAFKDLEHRESRCRILPPDAQMVREFVAEHALL
jgi:threonine synthase